MKAQLQLLALLAITWLALVAGQCTSVVEAGEQCGGLSQAPIGVLPRDGKWAGYCCLESTCVRQSKWFHSCKAPTPPPASPKPKSPKPSPSPRSPKASPTPASCRRPLALFKQCGGLNTVPPGVKGKDGLWDGFCCPEEAFCRRKHQWYWQCVPIPVPSPSPVTGCRTRVNRFKQCGGLGSVPRGVLGREAQWAGYCCKSGDTCRRINKWYYQCLPAPVVKKSPTPTSPRSPNSMPPRSPPRPGPAPKTCAAGFELVAASNQCKLCPDNYYSRAGEGVCYPCPAGSESPADGTRAGCLPCPSKTYNDQAGSRCKACPTSSAQGATTCPN